MSKYVKQLQMDYYQSKFNDVRDMVLLNISGLDAVSENAMRLELRKKDIQLFMVKNSLFQTVMHEIGITGLDGYLETTTVVAWGTDSIASLSKEINNWVKKHDKSLQPKVALADGHVVPFEQAVKFPTREEAIAKVIQLALSPAGNLVSLLRGPAAKIAGQVKTISEQEAAS